ncbi:MAG: dockerin type I domain-containing protein, partial [Planctomycetota bacterium]
LGDIAADCDVDAEDYALLAARWKNTPCNRANDFCALADIDRQNSVNFADILILARYWLASTD